MDGYRVWKIHRAVNLHLTTLSYDLFEHEGRVKNSGIDYFYKTNARYLYEIIARNLEKPHDAVEFCLGNIIYTPSDMTLDQHSSWDNYKKYLIHKESMTRRIEDDLHDMDMSCTDRPEHMPELLRGIVCGDYLPQTAVAINRVHPFLDSWVESMQKKVYFGFDRYVIKLAKLDKFVKYNTKKIESLLEEKYHEAV